MTASSSVSKYNMAAFSFNSHQSIFVRKRKILQPFRQTACPKDRFLSGKYCPDVVMATYDISRLHFVNFMLENTTDWSQSRQHSTRDKQLGKRILRPYENPAAQNVSLHKAKQEMGWGKLTEIINDCWCVWFITILILWRVSVAWLRRVIKLRLLSELKRRVKIQLLGATPSRTCVPGNRDNGQRHFPVLRLVWTERENNQTDSACQLWK